MPDQTDIGTTLLNTLLIEQDDEDVGSTTDHDVKTFTKLDYMQAFMGVKNDTDGDNKTDSKPDEEYQTISMQESMDSLKKESLLKLNEKHEDVMNTKNMTD